MSTVPWEERTNLDARPKRLTDKLKSVKGMDKMQINRDKGFVITLKYLLLSAYPGFPTRPGVRIKFVLE